MTLEEIQKARADYYHWANDWMDEALALAEAMLMIQESGMGVSRERRRGFWLAGFPSSDTDKACPDIQVAIRAAYAEWKRQDV